MSQIEQRGGLPETKESNSLEIGGRYKLHFLGRNGEERVTIDANYIFEGVKEGRLRFAVLFDERTKTGKRVGVAPDHLELPELLFKRCVVAEQIGKPYNEAAVKYNPREEAPDLIAGLPPRPWMFQ